MNHDVECAWDETVRAALEKCAAKVEESDRGQWHFALCNGRSLAASARMSGEWFCMEAALEPGRGESDCLSTERLWDLLRWSMDLGGGAKFVVAADRRARLRAEAPLDGDIACRIREACDGFKAGAGRFFPGKQAKRTDCGAGLFADNSAIRDLGHLCAEAGWQFTERSDKTLCVQLDVSDGFYQASIQEKPAGGVRLSAELATWESLTGPCGRALGVFLLTASGVMRMARATADAEDGRTAARFEVAFLRTPSSPELAHALNSLSVACRLCGREARILMEEDVAREYLAKRGWSQ